MTDKKWLKATGVLRFSRHNGTKAARFGGCFSFCLARAACTGLLAVSVSLTVLYPAQALEGGQSSYLKGYRDFLSGVLPPPGIQFREDLYIYSGKEKSPIPGRRLLGVGLHSYASIIGFTAITPWRVLGGNYAFAVRAAASHNVVDRSVTTPAGATTTVGGRFTGFNDMVFSPIVLGWHAGNWHMNTSAVVWAPVGQYDSTRLVNTGRNFWSWSPQIAITYLDQQAGYEISGALSHVFNYENPKTLYRSGNVAHFDFAMSKQIMPGFWVGAVGYIMEQLTDDSGSGNALGDRRAQVFGIGPGVRYILRDGKIPVALVAKYYREFSARNTTAGDAASLSLRLFY